MVCSRLKRGTASTAAVGCLVGCVRAARAGHFLICCGIAAVAARGTGKASLFCSRSCTRVLKGK